MEWLSVLTATKPSEWARVLVRGAFDLHVHVAPDVMQRRITDLQLARRFRDAGLAGFALKSHYVPTAERAAVLNEAMDGAVQVIGTLTLNAAVGGMNPLAVEIAAREGARIVLAAHAGRGQPPGEARGSAPGRDPADVAGPAARPGRPGHHGGPGAGARRCGPAAARYRRGAPAGRPAPARGGHRAPERPRDPGRGRGRAGRRGAARDRHPPGVPAAGHGAGRPGGAGRAGRVPGTLFHHAVHRQVRLGPDGGNIRATGPGQTIITTDLGQPANPPVEDGLALMADALHGAGFTDEEITTMTVANSGLLAGADALRAEPRRM